MCVINAFDMPFAHFGSSSPWYVYVCVMCERIACGHALCSLWLQLTLVCVYIYIYDLCVRNAFDMPFAHLGSISPWYVYTYIFMYDMCARNAVDMPFAHFGSSLPWYVLRQGKAREGKARQGKARQGRQ